MGSEQLGSGGAVDGSAGEEEVCEAYRLLRRSVEEYGERMEEFEKGFAEVLGAEFGTQGDNVGERAGRGSPDTRLGDGDRDGVGWGAVPEAGGASCEEGGMQGGEVSFLAGVDKGEGILCECGLCVDGREAWFWLFVWTGRGKFES